MNRQRSKAAWAWGGLAFLLTAGSIPVRADEKGESLLNEVEKANKAAKTLSADLTMSIGAKDAAGKDQALKKIGVVKLKKPNMARIEFAKGGPFAKAIASDGKSLFILMSDNQYYKSAADAQGKNIEALWAIPISMFFTGRFKGLSSDKPTPVYVGKQTVEGTAYDVVQIHSELPLNYTVNLYIALNKLVARVDVQTKEGEHVINRDAVLKNIKVDAPISDSAFAYAPPKEATPYKAVTLDDYAKNLLAVNSVAPRFTLSAPNGGKVALDDVLKSKKAVLVNFWFYNCGACREEFPHLQKLYTELKDKGLELIALNGTDSADVINKYVKDNNFTFLVGMKGKGDTYDAAVQYRVEAYPTNYVLDGNGKIVFRSVGFDEAGIRAALQKLDIK